MSFFLFLLVNATLFLRPAEVVPELLGWPIFNFLIISCFVIALPEIFAYLSEQTLDAQPITLCVLALLVLVGVSSLANLEVEQAASAAFEFFKVVMYYMLFVSVVNSEQRLRRFVLWLLVFCFVLTTVAVLQYHEIIKLPTLSSALLDTDIDRGTGLEVRIRRLQGSGFFQDPNELCMILAALIPLGLYGASDRRAGLLRLFWLGELLLIAYAIALTQSRGGLLALLAGLGAVGIARFGARQTVALAALALPLLMVAYGGRQTEFTPSEGTGLSRVQVWSDWMTEFRASPVLGNGMTMKDEQIIPGQEVKLLAHNSYLQGFADLGVIGGMLFLGAFYLAVWTMFRIRRGYVQIVDPEMEKLHPFLLGTVVAYSVGMFSLSICYVMTTYMMLGLAAAFARVAATCPSLPLLRFDGKVLGRFALAGFSFLACLYVFIKVFIRWT